jgi:extradiol dioxygenase family protein
MDLMPFHLAIPVSDLPLCVTFYRDLLGYELGRSSEHWADLNMHGHQLVLHYVEKPAGESPTNPVDGDQVPVPHFGLVLPWSSWEQLAARIRSSDCAFLLAPRVRFPGLKGEQGTFFLRDPSGNALEFKAFRDLGQLFAT